LPENGRKSVQGAGMVPASYPLKDNDLQRFATKHKAGRRTAKPPSPVRLRSAPLGCNSLLATLSWVAFAFWKASKYPTGSFLML
jgi:hypothetical protein